MNEVSGPISVLRLIVQVSTTEELMKLSIEVGDTVTELI